MNPPLPETEPPCYANHVFVSDRDGKISVNFTKIQPNDPTPSWLLEHWSRIQDNNKVFAAQYLVCHGVRKEYIPEYRREVWCRNVKTKMVYRCGCHTYDIKVVFFNNKPEDFVEMFIRYDWGEIKHRGKDEEAVSNIDTLCSSCRRISADQVLNALSFDGPCITIKNTTYVSLEDVSRDFGVRSKKWHAIHGPKLTIKKRIVAAFDHDTMSMRIVRRYKRWPDGGPRDFSSMGNAMCWHPKKIQAVVNAIPLHDLPLALGINDSVDMAIKRRLSGKCLS